MVAKRSPVGRVKKVKSGDVLDIVNMPGNEDPEVIADGVALRRLDDRTVLFWPASFDRLPRDVRDLAELVMEWVHMRRELLTKIDATVPALREMGMSWGQVGFLVGMSSEGARQRWGTESSES